MIPVTCPQDRRLGIIWCTSRKRIEAPEARPKPAQGVALGIGEKRLETWKGDPSLSTEIGSSLPASKYYHPETHGGAPGLEFGAGDPRRKGGLGRPFRSPMLIHVHPGRCPTGIELRDGQA